MGWHEDTVRNIGNYCKQFRENVQMHVSDRKLDIFDGKTGKNCYPLIENTVRRKNQLYCPDITIKNAQNQITHFIEIVESSPGTPVSVLGVIFAADIAIAIMMNENKQQNINPKLFFIIQDPNKKYDTYWCSICNKIHGMKNENCMNWMKKKDYDIEKINDDLQVIHCQICGKNHKRNHNHIVWLKARCSPNHVTKEVKTENKWTRLFEKTLENIEVRNEIQDKIRHIEFPIFCYDTNYDTFIKF